MATMSVARSDLEAMFGVDNVKQWADLDNRRVAADIAARIELAITSATEQAYDILRGGPVSVPLDDLTGGIKRAVVQLAGVWLYESRGINDAAYEKRGVHRLSQTDKNARMYLAKIQAGIIRSDLENSDLVAIPTVVSDEDTNTTYYL